MDAAIEYQNAMQAFQDAARALSIICQGLLISESVIEQNLGKALLRNPERTKLIGLPAGTGISFEANYVAAEEFDLKGWPRGQEIANAVLARTEARMKLIRAYERVPVPSRSGMSKPSDIIDSVA